MPQLLDDLTDLAAKDTLAKYKREWKAFRPYEQHEFDTFRFNLENRWGKAFDKMRMLIGIAHDTGRTFIDRCSRTRSKRNAVLNSVLSCLHVRACQISAEIMALIENGYADGAMARWRTLHEVTVVAIVLNDGGDELAQRYLDYEVVEAKRALDEYQSCAGLIGYRPFSAREAKKIQSNFDAMMQKYAGGKYGKTFGKSYGWAAEHLDSKAPDFRRLETAAGRSEMRSHYKMASNNVHAGVKGIAHRLSTLAGPYALVAGATNVGFSEPGQNMALSLSQMTLLLCNVVRNADDVTQMKAIIALRSEIAPAMAKVENAIAREEKVERLEIAKAKAKKRRST
jgi:hypothetical protein